MQHYTSLYTTFYYAHNATILHTALCFPTCYIILLYATLYYTMLKYFIDHYTALYYASVHCTTLHCSTILYTMLQYTIEAPIHYQTQSYNRHTYLAITIGQPVVSDKIIACVILIRYKILSNGDGVKICLLP